MKLNLINKNQINILNNLLQLYLHDISISFPMDFDSKTGLYTYNKLDKYFDNSLNYSYFICKEDSIIGFILVDKIERGLTIQEIFILNNYKNKQFGKKAINLLFDLHKDCWTVKVLPCSNKAERFWQKTINEYTKGRYSIEYTGKYKRAVLTFCNIDR